MAFVINRGTKDNPRWYARYKDVDGKWKQRATEQTSKAAAKEWAADVAARVKRGLVGVPEPTAEEQAARRLTVAELCRKFLKDYTRPKLKDREAYLEAVRPDLNQMILRFDHYAIGDMLAAEVQRLHVERWRDALHASGYAPGSVNRGVRRLSRVYTWADDQQIIACRNPCARIELLQTMPAGDHYPLEEVHELLRLADLPAMVPTALYTGLRKGEAFGLTWPCIRLDGEIPRIEVRRSYNGPPKSGKPRTVPIHPELLPVLRRWKEQCPKVPHPGPGEPAHAWTGGKDEPLVFPVAVRSPSREPTGAYRMGSSDEMADLPELLRTAGCHVPVSLSARPPRTAKGAPVKRKGPTERERAWHACRHTFATLFLEASGGNEDALAKLLGHRAAGNAVTAGYTHTSLAYLYRELVKMTLAPPPPAGVVDLQERQRQRAQNAGAV